MEKETEKSTSHVAILHSVPNTTSYPICRLVLTGKDTDENFNMLFGRGFSCKRFMELHTHARIEALLDPPPGSFLSALARKKEWDVGLPFKILRAASYGEAETVKKAKVVQNLIWEHVRKRSLTKLVYWDVITMIGTGNWSAGLDAEEKVGLYLIAACTLALGIDFVIEGGSEAFDGDNQGT